MVEEASGVHSLGALEFVAGKKIIINLFLKHHIRKVLTKDFYTVFLDINHELTAKSIEFI